MKYYNLHIDFEPSWKTYEKVTHILQLEPMPHEKSKFEQSDEPGLWTYQIKENEEEGNIDFINLFLNAIEPKFEQLQEIGIDKVNILFWLVYEYQHQCALGFDPQELSRLGESGIPLNIDCHETKT